MSRIGADLVLAFMSIMLSQQKRGADHVMERFPAGFIFLFTLLSRYCTCSKVCIFTSSIYRGLCTRSISCHLRANPLPLFALGIYFLSDPLAQLQPEQPGYNMYNWPEASQQRHYALSLSRFGTDGY